MSYVPVVPIIVIELLSVTDSLKEVKKKMKIYKDHGVESILIVPATQYVYIYRPNVSVKKKRRRSYSFATLNRLTLNLDLICKAEKEWEEEVSTGDSASN